MKHEDLITATKTLILHQELIQELLQFSHNLQIPANKSERYIKQFNNAQIGAYECVFNILSTWKANTGKLATRTVLYKVLNNMRLVAARENLEKKLGHISETHIHPNNLQVLAQLSKNNLDEFIISSNKLMSGNTEAPRDTTKYILLVCKAIRLMNDKGSNKSFEETLDFCKQNQTFIQVTRGQESQPFLQLQAAEGRIYYTWKKFKDALQICEAVCKKQFKNRKASPEFRSDYWMTSVDLALCYFKNKRKKKALKLLRKTIDSQKKYLAKDDDIILETKRVYRSLKAETKNVANLRDNYYCICLMVHAFHAA